jgi:hypothetical protein
MENRQLHELSRAGRVRCAISLLQRVVLGLPNSTRTRRLTPSTVLTICRFDTGFLPAMDLYSPRPHHSELMQSPRSCLGLAAEYICTCNWHWSPPLRGDHFFRSANKKISAVIAAVGWAEYQGEPVSAFAERSHQPTRNIFVGILRDRAGTLCRSVTSAAMAVVHTTPKHCYYLLSVCIITRTCRNV